MQAVSTLQKRREIEVDDHVFSSETTHEFYPHGREGIVKEVDYDSQPPQALVAFDRVIEDPPLKQWLVIPNLIRHEYPRSSNRHNSLTKLTGRPELVLPEAKRRIDNSRPVQCYEHMKMKVSDLRLDDCPERISITLYENQYAGD